MSDFSLQIGTTTFTVLPGGDFGNVLQNLDFGQSPLGDVPRLAAVRTDAPRTFSFPALIQAASKDAAIALISAANIALSTSNILLVHSKNATQSVMFRTFPSGSVKQAPEMDWELSNWQQVQFTLTIEPFAYGSPRVQTSSALQTPGVLALSVGGEYPAPLTIELARTGSETWHCVYVALNEHPEWTNWLYPACNMTWSGMTPITDAGAYGNFGASTACVRTTSTATAYASIDTAGVPPGDYLVLARVKQSHDSSGTNATINIASNSRWTTTILGDTTATPTDIWRLYEVGQLSLPYSIVRGTATSLMQINVTCNSSSDYLCVDHFILLPASAGIQSWHPPVAYDATSGSIRKTSVGFMDDGTVYLNNVCDLVDTTGTPIRSLSGELIILIDEGTGTLPHVHADVTIVQVPRYSLYYT